MLGYIIIIIKSIFFFIKIVIYLHIPNRECSLFGEPKVKSSKIN